MKTLKCDVCGLEGKEPDVQSYTIVENCLKTTYVAPYSDVIWGDGVKLNWSVFTTQPPTFEYCTKCRDAIEKTYKDFMKSIVHGVPVDEDAKL